MLPLVLVALIGFAAHKEYFSLVANTESLDVVLHILHHYDLPFKRLAGEQELWSGITALDVCLDDVHVMNMIEARVPLV